MDFTSELTKIAQDVNFVLDEMLQFPKEFIVSTGVGMMDYARYAAMDAGKRLRSFLTVQSAALFDVPNDAALHAGAVVELIHNSSLVVDDLPCIDNDKLRRGKPSVWAHFGERNASLTGLLLWNYAYKILATDEKISPNPEMRLKLADILANAANGMIVGEWMDCEAEQGRFATAPETEQIQSLKTGQIFLACTMFGATLGHANAEQTRALQKFTDAMGLCFQITDDILDATGTSEQIGKTAGKDATAGKATYISLYGLDGARARARELAVAAKDALEIFGDAPAANNLRQLMDYMVLRKS